MLECRSSDISNIWVYNDYLQQITESPPWVFKICNVGGDDGATRGSRNNTADSEASSTIPISIATIAGTLAGGEAGPVNAGIEKDLVRGSSVLGPAGTWRQRRPCRRCYRTERWRRGRIVLNIPTF